MSSKLRPFLATKAASFSATFRTSASSGGGTGPSSTGSTAQAPRSEGGGLQHCQVHHHHHQQEPCLGHLAGPPPCQVRTAQQACVLAKMHWCSEFFLPSLSQPGRLSKPGSVRRRLPACASSSSEAGSPKARGARRPPAAARPAFACAAGRRPPPSEKDTPLMAPPPRRPGALLSAPRSPRSPRLPRSPAGAATRPGWRAMAARARNLSGFRLFF